jgi:uncharacterized protein (TIGR03437 family)
MHLTFARLAGIAFVLFAAAPTGWAKCEMITDWSPILKLQAPKIIGFTYRGVSFWGGDTVDNKVEIKTSRENEKPYKIDAYQYGVMSAECLKGDRADFSDEQRKLMGFNNALQIPASPILAASDLTGGDLDGDRISEAISTDGSSFNQPHGILVWKGTADGYSTSTRYATAPGAAAVLLADFNNDGIRDAAVANIGNFSQDAGSVSILLGAANGTFATALRSSAGISPVSLAAADFNGDGRMDLVVANQGFSGNSTIAADPGSVSLLLGNGQGSFAPAVQLATGGGPRSILAGDFNSDQRPDVAVANRDAGTVSLLLNAGNGTFQPAVSTQVGAMPTYLGAADFTADGKLDVAVLHSDLAVISVWLGAGDGTLRGTGRWMTGTQLHSFGMLQQTGLVCSRLFDCGAFVGTLRPTIFAADASGDRVHVHGVNANGTLASAAAYEVRSNPTSVAAADFNGDGRNDVALAASGQIQLLLSGPGTRLRDPQTIAVPNSGGSSNAVATGDFNKDGKADLAIAAANRIAILNGNGDGSFQTGASNTGAVNPSFVIAVDLNKDGNLDVASTGTANSIGDVSVFLGNGNGTFQAVQHYAAGNRTAAMAAGDVNGDGRLDLVAVNKGDLGSNSGGLSLFLANANGTYRSAVNLDVVFSPESAAIADFNNDGRADIVYSGLATKPPNFRFTLGVLPGKGDGTFLAPIETMVDDLPGVLAAADFNRDGSTDVMLAHCCGTTDLTQLLGEGDGTFQLSTVPGGADPTALAVADFNNDGRLDLAIGDIAGTRSSGVISILSNSLDPATHVSAASLEEGNLAAVSIVSAFGTHLATQTASAPTAEWPETLAGTKVQVRDYAGVERPARIAFASPGQINYVLPPGTARGPGQATITAGDGTVTKSAIGVETVAPGLFFVNATNLAAAFVLRVREGAQIQEPVAALLNNQIVPAPIDLGPDSDDVLLLLFGTGIRGRTSGSHSITIGGLNGEILYSGPQGQYDGLDQINVRVPKALRGRGLVDVVLIIEDRVANTVRLQFR